MPMWVPTSTTVPPSGTCCRMAAASRWLHSPYNDRNNRKYLHINHLMNCVVAKSVCCTAESAGYAQIIGVKKLKTVARDGKPGVPWKRLW